MPRSIIVAVARQFVSHNTGANMKAIAVASIIGLLSMTGCASIVGGSNQVISLETRKGPDTGTGAACRLQNDKGTWFVTTPGTVTVHRAYDDMNIKCEKDGMEPGVATVKSSTKGMAFGNILAGGIIGAAVDMGTGAAYDYPALITIPMGTTTTIAPPQKKDGDQQPTAVSAAPSATPLAAAPTK